MEAPEEEHADTREAGRFYDAPLTSDDAIFQFERLEPPNYRVMRQFEYVDRLGHWYRVPKDVSNNKTDFASIPFFLTWLVPKDGTHTPAAVLHDALIGGQKDVDYETSADETIPDRHADYLFREAMKQTGVPWLRRWIMWAAVALRTGTVRIEKRHDGTEVEKKRWGRIAMVGALLAFWAIVSALMALDVPDLVAGGCNFFWFFDCQLPWLGDEPWYTEIWRSIAMVGAGAVVLAALFAIVFRSQQYVLVGALAGVAVGFLGLPIIASLVGAAGYFVLQTLTSALRGE